jgi:hypothetical protein
LVARSPVRAVAINVAGKYADGAGAGAPINITVGTAVIVANSQSISL